MKHLVSCLCIIFFLTKRSYGDNFEETCNNLNQQKPTRPCPTSSLACVRNYFVENSECNPKGDEGVDDILLLDSIPHYFPYTNATSMQYNMSISGLSSGKIVDFIVDKNTNLVVLTLNFKDLQFKAKTRMVYFRPYHEPTVILSDTVETYAEMTLTAVITEANKLNLDQSITVANIQDVPKYDLGPCYTESKDGVVQTLFRSFVEAPTIAAQEAFVTRGGIISKHFIQTSICDFQSSDTNKNFPLIPYKDDNNVDSFNNNGKENEPEDKYVEKRVNFETIYDNDSGDFCVFENNESGGVEFDDYESDEECGFRYGSDCAFYDIPYPPLLEDL